MIPDNAIIQSLSAEFEIMKPMPEDFMQHLADSINYLIDHNFSRLLQILYRLDINESRLKEMLAENPGHDAGLIIAGLVVERERQKILSRSEFKRNDDIPDDLKW